jgi:hypothetical protein
MIEGVTVASWNTRKVEPQAYGKAGNHTCLWDIAREQLTKEGYVDQDVGRIRTKVDEIVTFHNKQTEQPGFRRINNPDVIHTNQTIYTPPFSTTVPGGTKLKPGDSVASPDGNTVMRIEPGNNQQGQTSVQMRVYRNDGGGVGTAADLTLGADVQNLEITSDGKMFTNGAAGRTEFGAGYAVNARLEVQNDGNVVLYGEKSGDKKAVLWASNSQRIPPAPPAGHR